MEVISVGAERVPTGECPNSDFIVELLGAEPPPCCTGAFLTETRGQDHIPVTGTGRDTEEVHIDVTAVDCGTVTEGVEVVGRPRDSIEAIRLVPFE